MSSAGEPEVLKASVILVILRRALRKTCRTAALPLNEVDAGELKRRLCEIVHVAEGALKNAHLAQSKK